MVHALTRKIFCGPWAGLPVAWDEHNRFAESTYRKDVERCCRAGVPGVYTGGTSGEFYAQEFDEFKAVAAATASVCREHSIPCMIGCTATYTLGVIRRAVFAAECGAQAIQVALPFWMEVADSQVVPFFREVSAAVPDLALSIYETRRTKKTLTLEQHRQIKEAVPAYLMVKSNHGTLGRSPDGCRQLSEFVNVFAAEDQWAELAPHGLRGGCSSLIYWFPSYLLKYWGDVEAKNWTAVKDRAAEIDALFKYMNEAFAGRDFTDSCLDRLGGAATGFLAASLRCREPYPAATDQDVRMLRAWMKKFCPEMLKL